MLENLSVKERHQLNFDWRHLGECCFEKGRAVTAAEYAAYMGIARSTSGRRLVDLVTNEVAITYRTTGRNKYPKISYEPIGKSETWDYTYGWYSGNDEEG